MECLEVIERKKADGTFLEAARDVSKKYPNIRFKELTLDSTCMKVKLFFSFLIERWFKILLNSITA